jgi:hypothetical protein
MTTARKALIVIALAGGVIGLRAYVGRFGADGTPPPNPPIDTTVPHADHLPRRGGLVFMNGNTHLEVLVSADGMSRVYFTDAVRMALPPDYASEVTMGLVSREERQQIALRMDPGENVWIGRLKPVDDRNAIVRVSYLAKGERPYWIDLPLSATRPQNTK